VKQIPDTAKAPRHFGRAVAREVVLAAQSTERFVEVDKVAALTCS
jgi:hypothetical protein